MKGSILLALVILTPGWIWAGDSKAFQKDLSAFYKNPRDLDLQEKIIQDVLALKSPPALPSAAVSLKGEAKKALEDSKFKEAAESLLTASQWAPWNSGAYSDLAQAQEKAGLYPEALQSLDLYLLSAPKAEDRPQVQERIKKLDDENQKWMADQIRKLDDVDTANSLANRVVEMGPAAKAEVAFLIKTLRNNDDDTRAHAAFVLGQIKPPAAEALSPLAERLDDPQTVVRENASDALSKMGPGVVQVLPDLIDSLKDEDGNVRNNACIAIGNIGAAAVKAIPALVKVLKDGDSKVRGNSASALGRIGPGAKEALPALEGLSNDSNSVVKKNVAEAIQLINAAAD